MSDFSTFNLFFGFIFISTKSKEIMCVRLKTDIDIPYVLKVYFKKQMTDLGLIFFAKANLANCSDSH